MAGAPQPSYEMIASHPAALPVQHTIRSTSSVTPPPTDEKAFTQTSRVVALFKLIKAGRHINQNPWTSFQLAPGEYDEIERQLSQDESLWGYVENKIRRARADDCNSYDYDGYRNQLVVRMLTNIHESLIAAFEKSIIVQLELISNGSDKAALFAPRLRCKHSTDIYFPSDDAPHSRKAHRSPDTSFRHLGAHYPGVIVEVSYSQKRKDLRNLAETYLLDSDTSVQVVVGLDIEYGKKGSRKATFSVWRGRCIPTADGVDTEIFQEITDEPFRDDQGDPTDHLGLKIQLGDFACPKTVERELGDQNRELVVSAQELCQYLTEAETQVIREQQESLNKVSLPGRNNKRKRTATPPDQLTPDDEERFAEQEQRAAGRMEKDDLDYRR
ncbi:hypothetical protein MMC29_004551 [Sticta canariensis]|nr:hypothetical protein [Sticta canariensis]